MPGVSQSSQNYMSSQEAVVFESVFELGLSEIIGALKIKQKGHLVALVMQTSDFKVTLKKRQHQFLSSLNSISSFLGDKYMCFALGDKPSGI